MSKRRIGTDADTPHSLRMKAAEFRRLAEVAKDGETMEDLRRLAEAYEEEAEAKERGTREACGVEASPICPK